MTLAPTYMLLVVARGTKKVSLRLLSFFLNNRYFFCLFHVFVSPLLGPFFLSLLAQYTNLFLALEHSQTSRASTSSSNRP